MPFSLDSVFRFTSPNAHARYWLMSDLQQQNPDFAERYFQYVMDDFDKMDVVPDGICYLGDAAEGRDEVALNQMIEMQVGNLEQFNVPIYYVMGNHEFDIYYKLRSEGKTPRIPFYEYVRNRPLWHLIPNQETFWFVHETPEFTMLFFSDHAAKDGSWVAVHQFIQPDPTPEDLEKMPFLKPYPHTAEMWQDVRDKFANTGKPVFTFSHCAFPGGNRPSQFLERILPLPENFRAHFHGHSHIGDQVWGGKDAYRQIAAVDDQAIPQFDISSLDHLRGTTTRSAVFEYYGDGQFGVFFRDHINHRWENAYLSAFSTKAAGIPEKFTLK